MLYNSTISHSAKAKSMETVEESTEKAMASHSSTLAWKIPWMEEPDRLQSMGSLKVRHGLSDFTFTFHFHALEKEMATHSSILAWRIPGTGEPGGLPPLGFHRVRYDWSDLAAAAAAGKSKLARVGQGKVEKWSRAQRVLGHETTLYDVNGRYKSLNICPNPENVQH